MQKKKRVDAIKVLQKNEKLILNELKSVVKSEKFNYRTFGTDIEDYISSILIEVFRKEGFVKNKGDYIIAPNKNHFPDFELKTLPSLAVEYKTGNKSQQRKGRWVAVKNSENDMGTLNDWGKRLDKYGGDGIHYLFVLYNFTDKVQKLVNVEIAPFYKFLGLNKDGTLKYREKDGNLRPKDFDAPPPITSYKQFSDLMKKTIIYRSKRIIKKHRAIIKSTKPKN